MPVKEVTGDLFEQDYEALAHGVNCRGVMGSGIAPLFKRRWPEMFQQYSELCGRGTLRPGLVFPWVSNNGIWIYNLASQDRPGPDARLSWIQPALRAMRLHAETHHVGEIHIPRIGAGIGGLEWPDVKSSMNYVFDDSRVELIVVSLPGA